MRPLSVALIFAASLAQGCFSPRAPQDCTVQCAEGNECPSGTSCRSDGLCYLDDNTPLCADRPDASADDTIDANPGDFEPSNGATVGHLDGVTDALDVPQGKSAFIDTDTGLVEIDGAITRQAGTGVVAGIGFHAVAGSRIRVLAVASVDIGRDATLVIRGSAPLIVWSAGDVVIAGVVDATGGCDGGEDDHCAGPGGGEGGTFESGAAGCGAGMAAVNGGGAGHGEPGSESASPNAGSGGPVCGSPSLVPLVGGSGGGSGGGGMEGGGGGGAIQISSRTSIMIQYPDAGGTAGVNVGGAGGMGSSQDLSGVGGGGSGGAILIEGPRVDIGRGAVLAANGGGGGGIQCNNPGQPDGRGETGRLSTEQARGGCSGGPTAGNEGGSAEGSPAAVRFGGGAGGVGRIRIHGDDVQTSAAVISPAAL